VLKDYGGEVAKSEFQQKLQTELSWVQATKDAILRGKDTYLQLLEDCDPGSRIAAACPVGIIGASDFDTLEQTSTRLLHLTILTSAVL
jgi:hypothetical protein